MNRMFVNRDLEIDPRVFQKAVDLFHPGYLKRLVLVACLIVVAVFPKNADAQKVLTKLVGAAEVRSGEKTQTAAINFQRLMNRKFHGEVCYPLAIAFVNRIGYLE